MAAVRGVVVDIELAAVVVLGRVGRDFGHRVVTGDYPSGSVGDGSGEREPVKGVRMERFAVTLVHLILPPLG